MVFVAVAHKLQQLCVLQQAPGIARSVRKLFARIVEVRLLPSSVGFSASLTALLKSGGNFVFIIELQHFLFANIEFQLFFILFSILNKIVIIAFKFGCITSAH